MTFTKKIFFFAIAIACLDSKFECLMQKCGTDNIFLKISGHSNWIEPDIKGWETNRPLSVPFLIHISGKVTAKEVSGVGCPGAVHRYTTYKYLKKSPCSWYPVIMPIVCWWRHGDPNRRGSEVGKGDTSSGTCDTAGKGGTGGRGGKGGGTRSGTCDTA